MCIASRMVFMYIGIPDVTENYNNIGFMIIDHQKKILNHTVLSIGKDTNFFFSSFNNDSTNSNL